MSEADKQFNIIEADLALIGFSTKNFK